MDKLNNYASLFSPNSTLSGPEPATVRTRFKVSEEDSKEVIKLLNEKDKIIEENGFWANFKLKKIDKKIEKIKINSKKNN